MRSASGSVRDGSGGSGAVSEPRIQYPLTPLTVVAAAVPVGLIRRTTPLRVRPAVASKLRAGSSVCASGSKLCQTCPFQNSQRTARDSLPGVARSNSTSTVDSPASARKVSCPR